VNDELIRDDRDLPQRGEERSDAALGESIAGAVVKKRNKDVPSGMTSPMGNDRHDLKK
jgi:hypothetical protein